MNSWVSSRIFHDIKSILAEKKHCVIELKNNAYAYPFRPDSNEGSDPVEEILVRHVGYDRAKNELLYYDNKLINPEYGANGVYEDAFDNWKNWEVLEEDFYGLLTPSLVSIWHALAELTRNN